MSHADDFIVSVHRELVAAVPGVPDCIGLADEPSGDFGIAHFLGIHAEPGVDRRFNYYGTTADGCAVCTFDDAYTPARAVIVHELGHALQDNTDGAPDRYLGGDPLLPFWTARGLPGTPIDSDRRAAQIARDGGSAYETWRHWAVEIFAECFAACFTPSYAEIERTANYGVPLDKTRMRGFFILLRSNFAREDDMTMSDEEFERRYLAMNAKHVRSTIVVVKDAFNDHEHALVGTELGRTGPPLVKLGNEPE